MLKANSTIEAIFEKFFNGHKNFVTPEVVEYGSINNGNGQFVYEIATGPRILENIPVGVTILKINNINDVQRTEHSQCVAAATREEALDLAYEYVENIKFVL